MIELCLSIYLYGELTACFHVTYVFRVNLQSDVAWISSNSLFKTELNQTHNHLQTLHHLAKLAILVKFDYFIIYKLQI